MLTQTFILHTDESRQRVVDNLHAFLHRLPDSKPWKVEIKQYRKTRSLAQNNALFGVAYPPLREATGHELEELHDIFCMSFFGAKEIEFNGQILKRPRRTTTRDEHGKRDVVDAQTFSEFYAHVQQQGGELGVYVPDPDPYHDGPPQ